MKDFNIKKELSSLRLIKADADWKERNREILSSQIGIGLEDKNNIGISEILSKPQRIFQFVSQPAFAVFSIALILIGGGSVSFYAAAHNTRPGDSLYIAKILSEKAQMVITFDEAKKNKMGLKFANDRALNISQILAGTDFADEAEKEKANKLTEDFKKEITIVRSKINNISPSAKEDEPKTENQEEDGFQVFSADFTKDGSGIQLSSPSEEEPAKSDEAEKTNEPVVGEAAVEPEVSSSTPEVAVEENGDNDANKIIEQAEKLFNEQDYDGAIEQLQKVYDIIEEMDSEEQGEVKGASESASSTDDAN